MTAENEGEMFILFVPLFTLCAYSARLQCSPKIEVENEIIWNNKFVTIAGKSVFYRLWYEAGVKFIKDLLTEDGNLMTLNAFQHTFGIKTHFLQYLGLLNAIPTSWKKKLKNSYEENEAYDCENKIIDLQNTSSKMLRNILTKKGFLRLAHLSGKA